MYGIVEVDDTAFLPLGDKDLGVPAMPHLEYEVARANIVKKPKMRCIETTISLLQHMTSDVR